MLRVVYIMLSQRNDIDDSVIWRHLLSCDQAPQPDRTEAAGDQQRSAKRRATRHTL